MNFFIQQTDDKFINNTIISLREMGHNVLSLPVRQDLYRIYHKFNFNSAIFLASKFDNEIAQFISEFCSKGVKFFIYHEKKIDEEIIQYYSSVCKNLSNTKHDKCIYIPELINQFIYKNNKEKRDGSISCFLEHFSNIPQNLEEYLYPNSKLKIKLFNNPNIKHHQNLGILDEYDRADVLNVSEYFLSFDKYYYHEAIACGCKVIGVDDLEKIDKTKNKKTKQNIKTYQQFIEANIL